MRTLEATIISQAVRRLVVEAACDLEPDILDGLVSARDREESPLARDILELLLVNADIASREQMPVCQDTGVSVFFAEVGRELLIEGDLEQAIQDGVEKGYREGYLRMSVCDPLTRQNTGSNTPAVVHISLVDGEQLRLLYLPKGCGSENMSQLRMLPPSAGTGGIVNFVCDTVFAAGSNPCPPVLVGVGIGGTFEKSALLAKRALFRPLGNSHPRADVADLEREILARLNHEGQGVEGLGGSTTALAVHLEIFPTHIASLPVAVNIQCHAHRHKEVIF